MTEIQVQLRKKRGFCPVCCQRFGTYRRVLPKLLDCFHLLCEPCVGKWMRVDPNLGSTVVQCQKCFTTTVIPDSCAKSLQTDEIALTVIEKHTERFTVCPVCNDSKNFQISCGFCETLRCLPCHEYHATLDNGHAEAPPRYREALRPPSHCRYHPEVFLLFRCMICKTKQCHECNKYSTAHTLSSKPDEFGKTKEELYHCVQKISALVRHLQSSSQPSYYAGPRGSMISHGSGGKITGRKLLAQEAQQFHYKENVGVPWKLYQSDYNLGPSGSTISHASGRKITGRKFLGQEAQQSDYKMDVAVPQQSHQAQFRRNETIPTGLQANFGQSELVAKPSLQAYSNYFFQSSDGDRVLPGAFQGLSVGSSTAYQKSHWVGHGGNAEVSQKPYQAGSHRLAISSTSYKAGPNLTKISQGAYQRHASETVTSQMPYQAGSSETVTSQMPYQAGSSGTLAFQNPYQAGSSGTVAFQTPYQAGSSGTLAFQNPYQAGSSGTVAFQNPYQAGSSGTLAFQNPFQAGSSGTLAFQNPYQAGSSETVAFQNPYQAGSNETVAFQNPYQAGSSETVAFQNPYQAGSNETVAFQNPYQAGSSETVAFQNPYQAGSSETVTSQMPYQAGSSGTVAFQNPYQAGSSETVTSQMPYQAGSSGTVAFQNPYQAGSSGTVAFQNPYQAGSSGTLAFQNPYQAGSSGTVAFQNPYQASDNGTLAFQNPYQANDNRTLAFQNPYQASSSRTMISQNPFEAGFSVGMMMPRVIKKDTGLYRAITKQEKASGKENALVMATKQDNMPAVPKPELQPIQRGISSNQSRNYETGLPKPTFAPISYNTKEVSLNQLGQPIKIIAALEGLKEFILQLLEEQLHCPKELNIFPARILSRYEKLSSMLPNEDVSVSASAEASQAHSVDEKYRLPGVHCPGITRSLKDNQSHSRQFTATDHSGIEQSSLDHDADKVRNRWSEAKFVTFSADPTFQPCVKINGGDYIPKLTTLEWETAYHEQIHFMESNEVTGGLPENPSISHQRPFLVARYLCKIPTNLTHAIPWDIRMTSSGKVFALFEHVCYKDIIKYKFSLFNDACVLSPTSVENPHIVQGPVLLTDHNGSVNVLLKNDLCSNTICCDEEFANDVKSPVLFSKSSTQFCAVLHCGHACVGKYSILTQEEQTETKKPFLFTGLARIAMNALAVSFDYSQAWNMVAFVSKKEYQVRLYHLPIGNRVSSDGSEPRTELTVPDLMYPTKPFNSCVYPCDIAFCVVDAHTFLAVCFQDSNIIDLVDPRPPGHVYVRLDQQLLCRPVCMDMLTYNGIHFLIVGGLGGHIFVVTLEQRWIECASPLVRVDT